MPVIDVHIVHHGDPPPFDGLTREIIHLPDATWRVVFMEGGMQSGAASVALRLDLPDGRTVIAETSLAAWISATAGARGAFPEAFSGGPFAAQAGRSGGS